MRDFGHRAADFPHSLADSLNRCVRIAVARHWNVRRSSTFIRQVVTAVVVGVATIFVPKTVADEHWSTPPTVLREEDAPRAAAGGRLRDS